MDRPPAPAPAVALLLVVVVVAAAVMLAAVEGAGAEATGVFHVRRSLPAGGAGAAAEAYRAHDGSRRGRLLAAADIPLGGLGLPTDTGLYYTEIGIGTPTKRYYVQVDTGSDILWVNCISCDRCPRKSGLGVTHHLVFFSSSFRFLDSLNCGQNRALRAARADAV
jgi:hypothetical protein